MRSISRNIVLRTFQISTDLLAVETFLHDTLTERYQTTTLIDIHRTWSDGFILCLEETPQGARLVGLTAGILSRPESLRVLLLAVAPDQRHKGFGQALLKELMARGGLMGAHEVVLEVKVGTPAVSFYQRRGFSIVRTLPLFYQDCQDGLLMRRPLSP